MLVNERTPEMEDEYSAYHLPLPWKNDGFRAIVAADGRFVGAASKAEASTQEAWGNAYLIVRAVNAYEDMLAALEGIVEWLDNEMGACRKGCECVREPLRRAIAKAKGQ